MSVKADTKTVVEVVTLTMHDSEIEKLRRNAAGLSLSWSTLAGLPANVGKAVLF